VTNTPPESSTRSIQLRSSADCANSMIRSSRGSSRSRSAITGGKSIEYQVNSRALALSSRQKLGCSPSASATTARLRVRRQICTRRRVERERPQGVHLARSAELVVDRFASIARLRSVHSVVAETPSNTLPSTWDRFAIGPMVET
jgi:hypothetical protein